MERVETRGRGEQRATAAASSPGSVRCASQVCREHRAQSSELSSAAERRGGEGSSRIAASPAAAAEVEGDPQLNPPAQRLSAEI